MGRHFGRRRFLTAAAVAVAGAAVSFCRILCRLRRKRNMDKNAMKMCFLERCRAGLRRGAAPVRRGRQTGGGFGQ